MPSKRETANKTNAAKSTGPRTEAGKSKSSRNAVTHGLTSATAVIPGEDPKVLQELEAALMSQYIDSPVAEALCTQFASVLWRLARVRKLEAVALLASESARFSYGLPVDGENVYTAEDACERHPTQDYLTLGEGLGRDLMKLLGRLGELTRYESMLFAQLVRLEHMLEPFALPQDRQSVTSVGADVPPVLARIESKPVPNGLASAANQSQH